MKGTTKKGASKKGLAKKTIYDYRNSHKKNIVEKKKGWTIRKSMALMNELTGQERSLIAKEWPLMKQWPREDDSATSEESMSFTSSVELPTNGDVEKSVKRKSSGKKKKHSREKKKKKKKKKEKKRKKKEKRKRRGLVLLSPEEYAFRNHVVLQASKPENVMLLSQSIDFCSIAEEFNRFIEYTEDYPKGSELKPLLLPLFVYFYFLLLPTEESKDATVEPKDLENAHFFYDSYAYHIKNHDDVLKQLRDIRHIKDFKEHPHFKVYWKNKQFCRLSQDVAKDLLSFLGDIQSKALMYVFSLHFEYKTAGIHFWKTPTESSSSNVYTKKSVPSPSQVRELNEKQSKKSKKGLFMMRHKPKSLILKQKSKEAARTCNETKIAMEVYAPMCGTYASSKIPIGTENRIVDNYADDPLRIEILDNLQKSFRLVSATVLDVGKHNLLCLDLNCDCTELCISLENSSLCVSALSKKPVVKYREQESKEDEKEFMSCKETTEAGGGYQDTPEKEDSSSEYEDTTTYEEEEELEETVDESFSIDWKSMRKTEIGIPAAIVKYTPDEPHLLLAAHGQKIHLFNSKTGEFTSPFNCNDFDADNNILSIDFNSVGTAFATGNEDGCAYVWDFKSRKIFRKLSGHADAVCIVKFHPNDIYLATGSKDCIICLWEVQLGYNLRTFVGHDYKIDQIAISFDGKVIASADETGKVILWNLVRNKRIADTTLDGSNINYKAEFPNLNFNGGGFVLGGFNFNRELQLWDMRYFPNDCYKKQFQNTPLLAKISKDKLWNVILLKDEDNNDDDYEMLEL